MSEEQSRSSKLISNVAGIAGGAGLGTLAYKVERNRIVDQLVNQRLHREYSDAILDDAQLRASNAGLNETEKTVRDAFLDPQFIEKRAQLQQGKGYATIRGSEAGLEHLGFPELVHEVDFQRNVRGYTTAEVKLNALGLSDITSKEIAAQKGLVNAEFDAAGKAVKGSYIIHGLHAEPESMLLSEKIVGENGKIINTLKGSHLPSIPKEWFATAEQLVADAKLHMDGNHIPGMRAILNETSNVGSKLTHTNSGAMMNVAFAAVAGVSLGAYLGKAIAGKHAQSVVAQRLDRAQQTDQGIN